MPFRGRGRRRPFINSRWQLRRLECLCLFLSANVRTMLTAWMKIYGETNDVPGLVSGPIEVRFRRLREHTGADTFLLWTTPDRWAAGEGLSLWIPSMGLALECRIEESRLIVEKARPTTEEERDPRRQRSAVGMELRPERIELPPPDEAESENPSAGLVASFERLLDRRWTSFVDPLREALEAEARDDTVRAERLATPYAAATPRIGSQSESDPYRLSGVEASAVAAFDEGEWLDLVDTRGRVISSARLVRIDPAEGTMDVDVRGADPPSEGTVRPRPQTQILAQKRAILDELDNPTGGLANAVRLVASPASLPPPQRRRPANFVNRLVAQNKSQVRAVSLALGLEEGQALMVQGPPGTGKSTTLAEVLGQLVTRDTNATILVCSHSNHGVDNLLLKTLPYLDTVPGLAIARVGLFDRVHPQARPHYVPPGEDLGAFNVVFTTVDALALQVEAGGRTYDYAVLDEANRASILDSLIPLVRGRRFILVGDHLQLQPVLSEAEEQLRLEPAVGNTSAIGKSLFAWLREKRFPEAATVFLDEQNRMHPTIAGLISEVFYEGKLRSGRRAPRRVADVPLFPSAVTWVDTRGLHGLREARGRGASLVNVPEARLVATIARHILGSSQKEVEVGVISAYAEQTALLRRLLIHRNNPRQNGQNGTGKGGGLDRAALKLLEIDTVDAFEGREKDIIIVSLVRSNRRRDIGFLRLMQRINVALSRARTMLIVVGDTSTLRGSYFDRIVRYVRANGMLVPGPRLIGRLLNARNAERTGAERPGERVAGAGRRRRPLPSARNAFPLQDPAAAAAGPAAGAAGEGAAEEGSSQRSRRRRRRTRGRANAEQRPLQPTTTMEMSPVSEPEADEPATQYEIDRFAALVEQLLGDTSSDEGAADGVEAASAPEVDRAHAEEVLAEALRAVGEQSERAGQSRSRRNNRRRGRRGPARPLPGDAAVADAARRMAREELLAAGGADTLPMEMPGDSLLGAPLLGEADQPFGQPAASGPANTPFASPPDVQPNTPAARPAASLPAFRPFDAPRESAGFQVPGSGERAEAGVPGSGAPTSEEATPPAAPPRRTRRRTVAADAPALAQEPTAPASPTEVTPAPAPVRRRRTAALRTAADTAAPVVPTPESAAPTVPAPIAAPSLADATETPAPRRRTRRTSTAESTPAADPVATPAPATPAPATPAPTPEPAAPLLEAAPDVEAAPARRTRRRVATAPEAVSPAATPLPAATEIVEAATTTAPRRTRRTAAASANPASANPASASPAVVEAVAPPVEPPPSAEATPAAPAATPATPAAAPKPARRTRATKAAEPAAVTEAASHSPAPAPEPVADAAPAPTRTRRRTAAATAAPEPAAPPPSAPEPAAPPSVAPEPVSESAPTPTRTRRRTAVATAPVAAEPSAPADAPAAPTRRRRSAAAGTPPADLPLSAPERRSGGEVSSAEVTSEAAAAPKPRRTRKAAAEPTATSAVAPTDPESAPARSRRTRRAATTDTEVAG